MNQQDITIQKRARRSRARTEWPTLIGLAATVVVIVFQGQLFNDLSDTPLAPGPPPISWESFSLNS